MYLFIGCTLHLSSTFFKHLSRQKTNDKDNIMGMYFNLALMEQLSISYEFFCLVPNLFNTHVQMSYCTSNLGQEIYKGIIFDKFSSDTV